jgi:hypothetical protein
MARRARPERLVERFFLRPRLTGLIPRFCHSSHELQQAARTNPWQSRSVRRPPLSRLTSARVATDILLTLYTTRSSRLTAAWGSVFTRRRHWQASRVHPSPVSLVRVSLALRQSARRPTRFGPLPCQRTDASEPMPCLGGDRRPRPYKLADPDRTDRGPDSPTLLAPRQRTCVRTAPSSTGPMAGVRSGAGGALAAEWRGRRGGRPHPQERRSPGPRPRRNDR